MSDLPLGQSVDYDADYDPQLLCPIAREPGRTALGLRGQLPFRGWDIWTAYELSWLDMRGKPLVACGEIHVPADSPNIVESKSLKLYFNSLNQHRFADVDSVRAAIVRDLTACLGVEPVVQIMLPSSWARLDCTEPLGVCIDDLDVAIEHYQPAPELLRNCSAEIVTETLFSRLLRSRCPVTGQPDWATVQIDYTGPAIDREALLAYLISFRLHQDFHEHCVERIFVDLQHLCSPRRLSVCARYLRRGGIDINPFRSSEPGFPPSLRCFRQ
ncbi:MAG TPA: NADPH-dependent 7-cyano-7-deazaguanine reductase QueF [Spongiibacteraceae bacterium]|nr:NADPH-dependent 7-cyano-7-deazaguanine reductase QueF [Spongiibacteraceae bacterium]